MHFLSGPSLGLENRDTDPGSGLKLAGITDIVVLDYVRPQLLAAVVLECDLCKGLALLECIQVKISVYYIVYYIIPGEL